MADRPWRSFFAHKLNAVVQRLGLKVSLYEQAQQAYFQTCLKRYKIELVNSHATYSDRLCVPVMQQQHIPFIITEHGEYTMFLREGRRDFVPTLRQAQAIIAVSDYCRRSIQATLPELPTIVTIPNGIRVDALPDASHMRTALDIAPAAFVFGMVARGIAEKGWQQAIEAFLHLPPVTERESHLVLVGGSAYLDALQQQYGQHLRIHFVGRVPNPDFYIAGFDVGLLPSYFAGEALPLAVIEYLFYGKPAIATAVGGITEIVHDDVLGAAGQLVELDSDTKRPDAHALARAMQRYLDDASLYEQHQQTAKLMQQKFSLEACVRNYEAVFKQHVN
jgi:glycosyltransferase involved in cell wall biosynthesis